MLQLVVMSRQPNHAAQVAAEGYGDTLLTGENRVVSMMNASSCFTLGHTAALLRTTAT